MRAAAVPSAWVCIDREEILAAVLALPSVHTDGPPASSVAIPATEPVGERLPGNVGTCELSAAPKARLRFRNPEPLAAGSMRPGNCGAMLGPVDVMTGEKPRRRAKAWLIDEAATAPTLALCDPEQVLDLKVQRVGKPLGQLERRPVMTVLDTGQSRDAGVGAGGEFFPRQAPTLSINAKVVVGAALYTQGIRRRQPGGFFHRP